MSYALETLYFNEESFLLVIMRLTVKLPACLFVKVVYRLKEGITNFLNFLTRVVS